MCLLVTGSLIIGLGGTAAALPPPPENPTDQEITDSQAQAASISRSVGILSAQVASTQGQIDQLNDDMALKAELAQKAAVDLDVAIADAQAAAAAASAAATIAAGAQGAVDDAVHQTDRFAAASFRQGSQLGSVSALFGSGSVDELLQRDQLLSAVSSSQLDVIGGLQRARIGKVNLEAAARESAAQAQAQQAAADQAQTDAVTAQAAAVTAYNVGQSQLVVLQVRLNDQQIVYQAATNTVTQLQDQRQSYNDWLVLKAAEEERLRKEAEESARQAALAEAARVAAEQAAAEVARVAAEQAAAQAAAQAENERQAAADRAAAQAEAAAAAERQAARNAQAAAKKPSVPTRTSAAPTPSAAAPAAVPTRAAPPATVDDSGIGATVVAAAKQWIGTTYAWGGGNAQGPARGIRDGGRSDTFGDYNKIGFDCSGLTLFAYAQAGIALPHYSGYQYNIGSRIAKENLQPGDLLYWANNTSDPTTIHHVAIWLGNDQILEARQSGTFVMISKMRWSGGYIGASRPR
ncbi:MAG: NlpC/P60 family protein [Nakamurella sp.]